MLHVLTHSVPTRRASDLSLKVYVVTGQHATTPIGAVGEGSSTTNAITPNAYTSTANNSRGFGCATDWNANGVPTSTDTEDAFHSAGNISGLRSEEHTSELQSLMRISYAVFCLTNK